MKELIEELKEHCAYEGDEHHKDILDLIAEIERLEDGNRKVSEMYARTNDMLCEVVAENNQLRAVVEKVEAVVEDCRKRGLVSELAVILIQQALRAAGEEERSR